MNRQATTTRRIINVMGNVIPKGATVHVLEKYTNDYGNTIYWIVYKHPACDGRAQQQWVCSDALAQ